MSNPATPSPMSRPLLGVLLALAGFVIFSSHDALIKSLGGDYGVFQIVFFSVLFSFVPMTLIMATDRTEASFVPHKPLFLLLRTTTVIIGMICGFYAFTVLSLAEAYSLLFASPLLITALSVPFLGEKVGARRWAAVMLGLVGVMVVLRPGLQPLSLGHMAGLTAAVANSIGAIVVRKVGREERSQTLILFPMVAVLLIMAVVMPSSYKPLPIFDLGTLALMGLLLIAGQIFVLSAYRSAPAALIAPMQYSQIIWAALFGFFFFQEVPDLWVAVGSVLIVSSGVFVVWRESSGPNSNRTPVTRTRSFRIGVPWLSAKPADKPASAARAKN
ncbi:MAG: DMT family transporter [Alphaproteobacteria bacterium]